MSVWPALAPDGSWYMTTSGANIATAAIPRSRAYTNAGVLQTTQPTGIPAGLQATLPVFSPDGKHLAFNFWARPRRAATRSRSRPSPTIRRRRQFSGLTTLFTPTTGVVSWSSFLPTNNAVVFEDELVSGDGQFGFTWQTGQGQLYWVDLATQTRTR